jgi:hypothetical protein
VAKGIDNLLAALMCVDTPVCIRSVLSGRYNPDDVTVLGYQSCVENGGYGIKSNTEERQGNIQRVTQYERSVQYTDQRKVRG